jgi:hypothetical protein
MFWIPSKGRRHGLAIFVVTGRLWSLLATGAASFNDALRDEGSLIAGEFRGSA